MMFLCVLLCPEWLTRCPMASTHLTDTCPGGLPRRTRSSRKRHEPSIFISPKQMASKGKKRPLELTVTAPSGDQAVHVDKKSKTADAKDKDAPKFPVLPINMFLPCPELHEVDPRALIRNFQLAMQAPLVVTPDGRQYLNMSCSSLQCPRCPGNDTNNQFLNGDLLGLTVAAPPVRFVCHRNVHDVPHPLSSFNPVSHNVYQSKISNLFLDIFGHALLSLWELMFPLCTYHLPSVCDMCLYRFCGYGRRTRKQQLVNCVWGSRALYERSASI